MFGSRRNATLQLSAVHKNSSRTAQSRAAQNWNTTPVTQSQSQAAKVWRPGINDLNLVPKHKIQKNETPGQSTPIPPSTKDTLSLYTLPAKFVNSRQLPSVEPLEERSIR
jgi:hypothetical protein